MDFHIYTYAIAASRYRTPLASCRCRLLAIDCHNQLPCNGRYACAATFLAGKQVLTEGENLRFAEAELQVDGSMLELRLPSLAELPGGAALIVHVEL